MRVAEPTALPAAQQTSAAAKLKAHDDAIRANAIRQGRQSERDDWCKRLGVGSLDEMLEVQHLRAEIKVRPSRDEERKHGRHRFYQGMVLGGIGGLVVSGVFFAITMGVTVSQMTDVFNRATVNGMVMATQSHAQACVPGQQLADGSRCPQAVPQP